MSHSVLRFIRHEPEGGATFEAFCTMSTCAETSGPQEAQDAAQDWCLRHTGRTGADPNPGSRASRPDV